jgi:hypothetical protein
MHDPFKADRENILARLWFAKMAEDRPVESELLRRLADVESRRRALENAAGLKAAAE